MTFLLLLTVHSCAWNLKEFSQLNDNQKKDLVQVMDVPPEQLEKFKEVDFEEKVEANATIVATPTPIPQGKSKITNTKKNKNVVPIVTLKPTPTPVPVVADRYPKDFPEIMKGYDEKSKALWNNYKPMIFIHEKMTIDIKYLGVLAGKIFLQTKPIKQIGDKHVFSFWGKMVSAPFYKIIYTVDDYIETFLDINKMVPIKYSLVQRESGQSVDDLQLFDQEKLKTYYWMKRTKRGTTSKDNLETNIPYYFQDSFSPIFFVRGLPLNIGDNYEFPVITRGKLWIIKIVVEKKELLDTPLGEIEAYRLSAETHFPGVLEKQGTSFLVFS
ncbi:MAG: DUF3108 domain-containing protein [Bacteriovoracaceae bacterium]